MEGLSPKLASELDSFAFPSGWAPAHAHLWGILIPLSSFDPLKLHNVEKKETLCDNGINYDSHYSSDGVSFSTRDLYTIMKQRESIIHQVKGLLSIRLLLNVIRLISLVRPCRLVIVQIL